MPLDDVSKHVGLGASVISIVSFLFAAYVFHHGLRKSAEEERLQKISVLNATISELEQVNWVIDRYLGLKGEALTKLYYHKLPVKIAEFCFTQSWFVASEIGQALLEIHQIIDRTNTQLSIQNSPEFAMISPSDWLDRKVEAMLHHQKKMPELKEKVNTLISEIRAYRDKL